MNLFIKFKINVAGCFQPATLIFVILFFCSFVSVSHAQVDALKITALPQYPGPFQTVNISIEDYSKDLNRIAISWSVNGKAVDKGTGLKNIQIKTGALGSVSTVSINMAGNVHTLAIRPTATDILWQADSYTPPFYKGKALHSNQDPITLVAEPFIVNTQGARLDPNKLIYRWKQDSSVIQEASGYGKRVFQTTSSVLPQPVNVDVEVSSVDNAYHSAASIVIPETSPEVLLYENHPLLGINFNKALNNTDFTLTTPELNIVAAPFFFSQKQKDGDLLSYTWKLNGRSINQQNNEVTFRKPDGVENGRSSVALEVKNLERFMQVSNTSFNVQFNKTTQNNSQSIF